MLFEGLQHGQRNDFQADREPTCITKVLDEASTYVIKLSGIIFGVFACCPIWAVLLNIESILLMLDQDPEIVA